MTATPPRLDERRVRSERALVAVVLLAGFVWRQDLVIAVAAVAAALPLVLAGRRPLAAPWDWLVARRVGPARRTVAARAVYDGDTVIAAALAAAGLAVLIGVGFLGRAAALGVALVAAFEAAAGVPLASWARRRARRR